MMVSASHREVILTIYQTLKDYDITWAITGSLGFALHGMDVEVKDIDLQMDKNGAYRIEKAFRSYIVRNVSFLRSEKIRSYFGQLKIQQVVVEIMGALQKKITNDEWEPPVDVGQHREFIDFEGNKLPVLSLSYEEEAYRRLGRIEKAEKIKVWLTSRWT
jgi:hypothetical protein